MSTLREMVRDRYPKLAESAVNKKLEEFEEFAKYTPVEVFLMTPRLTHAPEFLACTAFDRGLYKLTYGDICTYAWDLLGLDGVDEIVQLAQRIGMPVSIVRPPDADDIISPAVFKGLMWDAFKNAGVTRYSELTKRPVDTYKRWIVPSPHQQEVLRAKGLQAKSVCWRLEFSKIDGDDWVKQYEKDGFIAFPHYQRQSAEAVVSAVRRTYPDVKLQFDINRGVILK